MGRLSSAVQWRNRRILYQNLEIVFGRERTPRELRALRSDIYANFGRFVYEFVHLPCIDENNLHDLLTPRSIERAHRLGEMARREPVISVTAHLGHWELGAAAVGLAGCPVVALVDSHPNPRVTGFFNEVRLSRGVEPIPTASFLRLFRALKRGVLVAIVGDRAVTGQGITMRYFGRDFLAPDGYAVLARRFGAAIVPTFCFKQENGVYEFMTTDPIRIEPTDDAEADIRDCVARVLAVIEQQVRLFPDQWYAFRPIWGLGILDRMEARRSRERGFLERSRELRRQAVVESHAARERSSDGSEP